MSCHSRKLLISEQEKKHILSLYNLISEDTPASENSVKITGKNFFGQGKWANIDPKTQQDLISQIEKAANFLSKNKGAFSTVKITASESQVRNYDREQSGDVPLEPGELSKRRAETMYKFMSTQFQNLLKKGVIDKIPIFERPFETKIGTTKWDSSMPVNNPAYDEERYVTAEVSIKEPFQCLIGLGIQVVYYKTPNPDFPCRGGHKCDLADFTVRLNGIDIGKVSLNNGATGNDVVPPALIVDPQKAKEIASKGGDKIIVSLVCNTGNNCHSSTPEVFITKKDSEGVSQVIWHECAAPKAGRGDMKERELLTLNACGEVIEKSTIPAEEIKKGDKTDLTPFLDKTKDGLGASNKITIAEFETKLKNWGFGNPKEETTSSKECSRLVTNYVNSPTTKTEPNYCRSYTYTLNEKAIDENTNKDATNVFTTLYAGITTDDKFTWVRIGFSNGKYYHFKIKNGKNYVKLMSNYDGLYKPESILKLPLTTIAAKELGSK